ncbi:MAG: extracellular solute-binding protein, partial [Clostridia bacterium]|nr:extracellular solute-binding protein [Clostridia bacterium]
MKKFGKIACLALGAVMSLGFACACDAEGSGGNKGDKKVFVIWCPEADHDFAKQVAADFLKENTDVNLEFQFGIQGENDAATKVLTDVENAPDVFSFASDQINKLIVGDALARVSTARVQRLKELNTAEAVDAATVTIGGEEQTYAFPYTDNTYFLYYNKSKFSEEDIKTLDGILDKCSEEEQFGYPMNDGWYNSAFFFGKD